MKPTKTPGRTILVGDIHGCAAELERLLDRVHFTLGDQLVLVGDLLARGPDSRGVLRIARETGALMVRGNHEDRVLMLRGRSVDPSPHAQLARTLDASDVALIAQAPLCLHLPEHDLYVVHAGIRPDLGMYAQADQDLLTLRTIKTATGASELWGASYRGPQHIVFGHHALQGLQLHPFATGLDTGCVYGKCLTALVLDAGEPVPQALTLRRKRLVQEPAARVYFDPRAPG